VTICHASVVQMLGCCCWRDTLHHEVSPPSDSPLTLSLRRTWHTSAARASPPGGAFRTLSFCARTSRRTFPHVLSRRCRTSTAWVRVMPAQGLPALTPRRRVLYGRPLQQRVHRAAASRVRHGQTSVAPGSTDAPLACNSSSSASAGIRSCSAHSCCARSSSRQNGCVAETMPRRATC
jgi:hypothetical protein